ncbi:helix-turn-helix domain-containing protein [Streptomyces monashensis]|uniref:helix-turn-helix domain-containing protein n=1 Tax=Streptomyces monashensis TaxID=1678012 RepID=UPI001FE775A2|nr:helix-turn-helix domain-containing protein [Streptomyces monashensis]
MTYEQRNARPPAKTSRSHYGVTHVKERLDGNFTVISNELLQHPELSTLAKGIGGYIQSLPEGTPVGIKALAEQLPEGEISIASALRELEAHGWHWRNRERLESGQVVTRTYSYNRPRHAMVEAARGPEPAAASTPAPPKAPAPAPSGKAAELLAGLRAYDSRLILSERDVQRLAPLVTRWLERGVPPTAVLRALTTGLPQGRIKHPAAFLTHRLTAQLPPQLPTRPPVARDMPAAPSSRPDPLQTCEGCDRAFRSAQPGRCRDCRAPSERAA